MADTPTQKPTGPTADERIAALEARVAAAEAAVPTSTIPEHGAGVGTSVAETWSAYDQALAFAGEHPDQAEPSPTKR